MDNLEFEKYYKMSGFSSQRRYPNEALIRFFAEQYLTLPQGKRARVKCLEIGCGSGANLWMMAREGFSTYGIDVAPSSIALCKQMLASYGARANITVGNFKKLGFKDGFFDVIVDVMTVEHTDLRGHREAYAEVFRCLKRGGRFFSWHLGAKSASFLRGDGKKIDRYTIDTIRNKEMPYADNGITCFITAPLVKKMLAEAGFVDISIERVTRTYRKMAQEMEYFAIAARKP